jgi:hypothetical protein
VYELPGEWAKEFTQIAEDMGITIDEDWMVTWFANAIMAGYDEGRRQFPPAQAVINQPPIQPTMR